MVAPTTRAEATAAHPQGTPRDQHGFTSGIIEVPTPGEEDFHAGCGGYPASRSRRPAASAWSAGRRSSLGCSSVPRTGTLAGSLAGRSSGPGHERTRR
jgi:hypothetical protein